MLIWSRQQESNLHLSLRRTLFYPLNYGEDLKRTNSARSGVPDYS